MERIWTLSIYNGPFICYETLPNTLADFHLDQKAFFKECI
jgi:hypothetical protein